MSYVTNMVPDERVLKMRVRAYGRLCGLLHYNPSISAFRCNCGG